MAPRNKSVGTKFTKTFGGASLRNVHHGNSQLVGEFIFILHCLQATLEGLDVSDVEVEILGICVVFAAHIVQFYDGHLIVDHADPAHKVLAQESAVNSWKVISFLSSCLLNTK